MAQVETPKILKNILSEISLIRNAMMLLLPQERLEEYSNSKKIRNSYKKALRRYPPRRI